MKIVQSVPGKFHHFHLARQLRQRDMLAMIFSSYPSWKLRDEQIPPELLRTFPLVHLLTLTSARYRKKYRAAVDQIAQWDRVTFDRYVARNLPPCDAFVGLSGSALRSGRAAQSGGAKYVCDRGSSHIRYGEQLMEAEFRRWGQEYERVDPRNLAGEEEEYAQADLITVPSTFAYESFVEMGVDTQKIRKVPYGADLRRFSKVADPDPETFDVLFVGQVSFRKGIPYLLEAFEKLRHPKKKLTIVGSVLLEIAPFLQGQSLDDVQFVGTLPNAQLKEIMSRSHVMVLPSLEEGLALVLGEAMACGCPLICSENCGGADLMTDGREGFLVPIRDAEAIRERLERLAQNPALRAQMSGRCLERVGEIGGWDTYGAGYVSVLKSLLSAPLPA